MTRHDMNDNSPVRWPSSRVVAAASGWPAPTVLADDGATVVLAGRNEEKLSNAAQELRSSGASVYTAVCDVTDEDSVKAACDDAAAAGLFTMVVANAGTGAASPLHLTSLDDWNSVMNTNLTGAFLTIKHSAAAPRRQRRRFHRGHLVHRGAAHAPLHDPLLRQQGRRSRCS